jgi:hypothetical protein
VIKVICGDPLRELQANAINTLSNTQIPGTNTWLAVIDWLNDFLASLHDEYAAISAPPHPPGSALPQARPRMRGTPCNPLFFCAGGEMRCQ